MSDRQELSSPQRTTRSRSQALDRISSFLWSADSFFHSAAIAPASAVTTVAEKGSIQRVSAVRSVSVTKIPPTRSGMAIWVPLVKQSPCKTIWSVSCAPLSDQISPPLPVYMKQPAGRRICTKLAGLAILFRLTRTASGSPSTEICSVPTNTRTPPLATEAATLSVLSPRAVTNRDSTISTVGDQESSRPVTEQAEDRFRFW